MARRKVDVDSVLPSTRRITRSQALNPGASPLTEKLPTPKRRPRKSENKKKKSSSSMKKKHIEGQGIVNGQDSGCSFGDTENQTTDTDNTENTEGEHTDLDRTDTDPDLTDADQTYSLLEKIDEYPESTFTESNQVANRIDKSNLAKPINGEYGSYVYETEKVRTQFNVYQRRTKEKTESGSVATGIAVETTIAAETTAVTEQETLSNTDQIIRDTTPRPLRSKDRSSSLLRDGGISLGTLVRGNSKETHDRSTPGRRTIYPKTNSILGKHINEEEDPALQRSMKRTKMSKPETAKAPSSIPHLDPNIRSLAFSFGSEELNQIRMLTPSRRQKTATQTLENSNKENDDPILKQKQPLDDTTIEEARNRGYNGDCKTVQYKSGETKAESRADEATLRESPVKASSYNDKQLVKTPNTSKSWGFRSIWGSVSRLLPGAHTEPRVTLDREDLQMSDDASPASPTPFRANNLQPPIEQSSQKPQKIATPSKPNLPKKGRTPKIKPKEKNADKRNTQHKAAWQLKEDNRRMKNEAKARRIREAEEREQKRKTKIKIHIDELSEIPTHRLGESGAYGMLDEFFVYDSDSDNEIIELDKTQYDLDDISPGSSKRSKRAKTSQKAESANNEVPQFAPMPENVEDPFAEPSYDNADTHRAKPYLGTLFADKADETTYKGGNVFGQSEMFSGNSVGSSSGGTNSIFSPGKTIQNGKNTKRVGFSQLPLSPVSKRQNHESSSNEESGVFCVPEDSDSDDSFSEDPNTESPLADQRKTIMKGEVEQTVNDNNVERKTGLGEGSSTIDKTNTEKLNAGLTLPIAKSNIFELGMKSPYSPSSQNRDTQHPDAGNDEKSITNVTEDHNQSQTSTQPPPLRQAPAYATPASNTSSAADSDALARARSQAEKYKPKQPSGLRASSKLSGASNLSKLNEKKEVSGMSLVPVSDAGESNSGTLGQPDLTSETINTVNDNVPINHSESSLKKIDTPLNDNNTVFTLPTSPIAFNFPPAIPIDPAIADLLQAKEKEKGKGHVVLYNGADLDLKAIEDFEARLGVFMDQSQRQQRQNVGLLGLA